MEREGDRDGAPRDDRGPTPSNLPSGIRLVEVVGAGATSVVWRARDRRRGRDVAVKVLGLPDGDRGRATARARFEHEARALARLSDAPHVLALLAAGTDRRCCWLVTPLADATLPSRAPLAIGPLLELAAATADGLAAAHGRHVVHGDVTPANVLWVDGVAVLSDFGLSVLRADEGDGPRIDAADRGVTPGYAAPERWDGAGPSEAADVYGWGATMWTAAVGDRPPLHDPPPPDRMPRGLAEVVRRCGATDPAQRPTMPEVRAAVAGEARRRARYCPEP